MKRRDSELANFQTSFSPDLSKLLGVIQAMASNVQRGQIVEETAQDQVQQRWELLTRREREVAHCVTLNMTNRQAAAQLAIGAETVKSHMERLLVKMDVEDRQDLREILRDWAIDENELTLSRKTDSRRPSIIITISIQM